MWPFELLVGIHGDVVGIGIVAGTGSKIDWPVPFQMRITQIDAGHHGECVAGEPCLFQYLHTAD